ncbi:hypothetical protein TGAM01_v207793 [Trichoderma gamsii]|uniref:HNH nuclease domain-containing protein n=1 Tax=Trichoderma gamsii TaxID=398673 RepID=A0A2P4ZG43_9HYPO|nr:hypothetical protein TGAM01_v207793 [Trichoderma gamsii]PON23266.1 hypothetical protein TGAM01_v207793 [Trichoderma gamsii]
MAATDQDTATNSSSSSESILDTTTTEPDTTRRILAELQSAFDALKRVVEPEVAPDQEQPEPDPQGSIMLASLGIEIAYRKKEAIQLERDTVAKQRKAGAKDRDADEIVQSQNQRYFSAGSDLWRHQTSKMRFGGPSQLDELDKWKSQFPRKAKSRWRPWKGRDSRWRRDALAYYKGNYGDHHDESHEDAPHNATWCHITGSWHSSDFHRAAHIVPPFLDDHGFVVPVDAKETPITQWRAEIVSPYLQKDKLVPGLYGKDIHGKELVFLNENRPVPRFLYFHFIMALIRIKDIQRLGWEAVWARYHEQRPFPTPSKYMRESMLLSLATHFGTTHMHVVETWIVDYGFESPLKLTEDESVEAARRVHMAVVERAERANRLGMYEDSDDSDDESDLDSEEE